ncbi:MAG: glycosyltransferase [Bacteroidales bacterium]|nr:glycosyltransferase [Bacteroidales bacterium]MCM1416091.1 glycosyltransferase [bacterium]MCM1423117.1 glycosyltransferase [bacterium]
MRILRIDNLRKTANYLKKNGLAGTFYAAAERAQEEKKADYRYVSPDAETLAAQRRETAEYPYRFSIVTPAYETKEAYLREMIASVQAQSYENWELVIADASVGGAVERTVRQIIHDTGDMRIRYHRLSENRGIAENTNAGIEAASGDYIALLDHDDFITPDALYEMALSVHQGRRKGCPPALLYSDEDKFDEGMQTFVFPNKKKEFNLDLILSNNYICHFMAVEAELMKRLKLRKDYDGAQDYDLVLRVVDSLWPEDALLPETARIRHIPHVLYHWRSHRESTALNTGSKTYAYEAGRRALEDFCAGRGFRVRVEHSLHLGFYRIAYESDLLTERRDAGMVGGRILNGKSRIAAGGYDEAGRCLYEGLPARFTGGSTHLASLRQDCAAADIRCMRLREELRPLFYEITGLPYREKCVQIKEGREKREIVLADVAGLHCDEAGYRKLSMALGEAVRGAGYLVVWDPGITVSMQDCETQF